MAYTDVVHSREAAAILGRTPKTVVMWAIQGKLPAVQDGHRGKREWLFERAEVEKRRQALELLGLVEPVTL